MPRVAIIAATLATALLQNAERLPTTVPAFLLGAAEKSAPEAFCRALLRAAVPCGLELREADDLHDGSPFNGAGAERLVPLKHALEQFQVRHPAYWVTISQTAIVIRPRVETLPFLDRQSVVRTPLSVTGLTMAIRHVFAAIDPNLVGGPVLNSFGYPGWDTRVVLDGSGGRTVVDTLNQIVTQARGHGWVVITRVDGGRVRPAFAGILQPDGTRRGTSINSR